jgi:hypothetical protein
LATGRQRSISLISELLFQSELEHKALLMPEEDLKQKAATFESSVARFEGERQTLSDFLSIDRRRLLKELEAETDRLWKEAQKEVRRAVGEITARPFNEKDACDQVTAVLSQYFEQALHQSVDLFRTTLSDRLAVHKERAGALITLVRQTAADLMEISVTLPRSEEAFEAKREPYWVAPEPSVSLLDISASVIARFLPKSIRANRARDQLAVGHSNEFPEDLEDPKLFAHIKRFAHNMRTVREHLTHVDKLYYKYQKEAWSLDAVKIYCDAIKRFAYDLSNAALKSRGFLAFRDYLNELRRLRSLHLPCGRNEKA